MKIGIATRANLPTWEVDDQPLWAGLERRGASPVAAVWDDPDVDWAGFDAVLIRTTWDYHLKCAAFVAWAENVAAASALFNPVAIVAWNTHKGYLRDLEARGVAVVPTVWCPAGSRLDLTTTLAERGWGRGFLKPAVGSTAHETVRFDAKNAAAMATAQAHLDRLSQQVDVLVQPYLSRVETDGELSAIVIDGALTHVVRKVPVTGDYRVQDDFGASDGPGAMTPSERDQALAAVQAAGSDLLYARVDFLRDDAGRLCLSELELVEPSLFFRHCQEAADRLAAALVERVRRLRPRAGEGERRRSGVK